MTANGLIWWSTPAATVGLVVYNATVIDCPPYARKWAMGRDARQLWREGKARGADLHWLPDPAKPADPTHCPNGHPLRPGTFSLSWTRCSCPGAGEFPANGHHKMYCNACGEGIWPGEHIEQK